MSSTDVALISLPWASPDFPNLAIGQLKSVLIKNDISCQNFYYSNEFYKRISDIYHQKTNRIIRDISSLNVLLAEWFFSRYAFGIDNDYIEKYGQGNKQWIKIRESFEEELEIIAHYDWSQFKYIGFTCSFIQTIASLALSRRIKELNPDITIILGGDSVDYDLGSEFVKKIDWVDWVIVGEGERALVSAIKEHMASNSLSEVPGLISIKNEDVFYVPPTPLTKDEFDDLPMPNFDEFYEVNPSGNGVWELSRGCWYGDKTLCSFCGMVPDAKYKIRSNPIEIVKDLKDKYDLDHMEFVDLLAPTNSIETIFEKSEELNMTFEITTRIDMVRPEEIYKLKTMSDGGLIKMFIGIESLHPKCIKLMKKGHLAIHCISFLKWAKYYGITVDWSILFGIPYEKSEYYFEMLEVLKKIPHLSPPLIQPIAIVKKSPYYKELKPLKVPEVYDYIYPDYLDADKVSRDFEFMDSEFMTNKMKNMLSINKIISHVKYWNNVSSNCSLTIDSNTVRDNRSDKKKYTSITNDELELVNFCSIPRKLHEVRNKFAPNIIKNMCEQSFLLELDQRLVSLIEPYEHFLDECVEKNEISCTDNINLNVLQF